MNVRIDRERELFFDLEIFEKDSNGKTRKKIRELNRGEEYDWVVTYPGESAEDGTNLFFKTPAQAFNYLSRIRPEIIKPKNREDFEIYVTNKKNFRIMHRRKTWE